MRSPAGVAALLVVVLATGCVDDGARAAKHVVSWGATAQRVGEAWLVGEVPSPYARRTARAAHEALLEQRSHVGQALLAERVDKLSRDVERLYTALEADDRHAVARVVEEIATTTRALGS